MSTKTSTERVRRWRNRNRNAVRAYDRARKAADRRLLASIFGITHKERINRGRVTTNPYHLGKRPTAPSRV